MKEKERERDPPKSSEAINVSFIKLSRQSQLNDANFSRKFIGDPPWVPGFPWSYYWKYDNLTFCNFKNFS